MQSTGSGRTSQTQRLRQTVNPTQRSTSNDSYVRYDDSWVEIASQPSSSSLSSVADEIITTGLRVQPDSHDRRRRRLRPGAPTQLNISSRPSSAGGTSSQEEYEESESESDRVLTSSNEGLSHPEKSHGRAPVPRTVTDSEDENRTAINYPTNEHCFTPQPNAFSHPPSSHASRNTSDTVPGSYFPGPSHRTVARPSTRHSHSSNRESQVQHSPYNVIAPAHNAAVDHEAALRASLSTLLSCAAAARGLQKSGQRQTAAVPTRASNRVETGNLRLVSESQLRGTSPGSRQPPEPTFNPTIRRYSASTSASAESRAAPPDTKDAKRKVNTGRSSSKDRRVVKKARRASASTYGTEELFITPTLLTWVVSAGVVVVLSALSFSAGYSMGKDAGKLEAGLSSGGEVTGCAKEATRTGLGLRRLRFVAKT